MLYVDHLRDHGWILHGRQVRSCHLLADTIDELHAFAQRLGLQRAWCQDLDHPTRPPHYDLTAGKRLDALAAGATEISDAQLADLLRRRSKAQATTKTLFDLPREP